MWLPSGSTQPTVISDPSSFSSLLLLPDSYICKVAWDCPPVSSLLSIYDCSCTGQKCCNQCFSLALTKWTPADPKYPDTLSPSAPSPPIPSRGTVTESPFERERERSSRELARGWQSLACPSPQLPGQQRPEPAVSTHSACCGCTFTFQVRPHSKQ